MKKIILLLFAAVVMFGCDTRTEEERYADYKAKLEADAIEAKKFERWHGFDVVVVDSCEYIIRSYHDTRCYSGYGYGFLAHKGNCKFCAARRKAELEGLVKRLSKK